MTFDKLLGDALPVKLKARNKQLPEVLNLQDIAELSYPDSPEGAKAFINYVLIPEIMAWLQTPHYEEEESEAEFLFFCPSGLDLKEKESQLSDFSNLSGNWFKPRGHIDQGLRPVGSIDDYDELPFEHLPTRIKVHRDHFKDWLHRKGEWPIKDSLLCNWWTGESENFKEGDTYIDPTEQDKPDNIESNTQQKREDVLAKWLGKAGLLATGEACPLVAKTRSDVWGELGRMDESLFPPTSTDTIKKFFSNQRLCRFKKGRK